MLFLSFVVIFIYVFTQLANQTSHSTLKKNWWKPYHKHHLNLISQTSPQFNITMAWYMCPLAEMETEE